MHLFGLFVFTLATQHLGQLIHARQRRWMLLAQHRDCTPSNLLAAEFVLSVIYDSWS